MKVAVVGSRHLMVEIERYLPRGITEIISGGAKGIDSLAENYAHAHGIPICIFLPQYEVYGKVAPLVRNRLIVDRADLIIAVWDGNSRGTKYTMDYAKKKGKTMILYKIVEK